MGLAKSWLEWLWPRERRGSTRKTSLPLEAYYWDGSAPAPHPVRDVSLDGVYVLTEQRWYSHTMLTLTLTRTDRRQNDPSRSARLTAKVVRAGSDGVGFAFIYPPNKRSNAEQTLEGIDRRAMMDFLGGGLQRSESDTVSDTPRAQRIAARA